MDAISHSNLLTTQCTILLFRDIMVYLFKLSKNIEHRMFELGNYTEHAQNYQKRVSKMIDALSSKILG
jgi:hypothetical protein